MTVEQVRLQEAQVSAFHHDHFVNDQVANFSKLVEQVVAQGAVVYDIGGGVGHFAGALKATPLRFKEVVVLDVDGPSLELCKRQGITAMKADALNFRVTDTIDVSCFNLILHHLVGRSENETRHLQLQALKNWSSQSKYIFVDEYIYESYVSNLSQNIIFRVTKSRTLSWVARYVSRWAPSLRANTFGVGVRFRSHKEWLEIFHSLNLTVLGMVEGTSEHVTNARRLLLMIKSYRRNSYLLAPKTSVSN